MKIFNKILIALFFIHLLLDGYLSIEEKSTSALIYIIYPLLFIGLIYNLIQNGFIHSKAVYAFLLFFFFIFLSFYLNNLGKRLALNIFVSLVSALTLFLWPSLFLYFSQQKFSIASVNKLFRFIDFLGILIALNCLIPFLVFLLNGSIIGEFIVREGTIRSFGFLTDQVGFALVYFLIDKMYKRKIGYVLLYASAIVGTGTRGAILMGLLACLVTWFFMPGRNRFNHAGIKAAFVAVGLMVFIFFFSDGNIKFFDNFNLRSESESIDKTSIQRIGAMKSGIDIFLNNPIFGIGYGNFSSSVLNNKKLLDLFDPIQNDVEYNTRGFANAQNQFIDIAANGGVICLLAAFFFIYYCIERARYLIRASTLTDNFKILLIFLVCMLLFNQAAIYLFNFGICSFLLMILLGIANADYYKKPALISQQVNINKQEKFNAMNKTF